MTNLRRFVAALVAWCMVVQPVLAQTVTAGQANLARTISQQQAVQQAAAALITEASDIDGDGFVEPPAMLVGSGGPAGGGLIPSTSSAPKTDSYGGYLGYCAWDNGSVNASTGRISGTNVSSAMVVAVVSAGLDNAFQTSCSDISSGVGARGDDYVVSYNSFQSKQGVSSQIYYGAPVADLPALNALSTASLIDGEVRLVKSSNSLWRYNVGLGWQAVQTAASASWVANGTDIAYNNGRVIVGSTTGTNNLTVVDTTGGIPVGLKTSGSMNGVQLFDAGGSQSGVMGYDNTNNKMVLNATKAAGQVAIQIGGVDYLTIANNGAVSVVNGLTVNGAPLTASAGIATTSLAATNGVTVSGGNLAVGPAGAFTVSGANGNLATTGTIAAGGAIAANGGLTVGGVATITAARDGSFNTVTASSFTGNLVGNATTATALQATRTIGMTGDGTWSVSFDGSGNASAGMVLANSGVTAGTYGSATTVPVLTVDAKGRITSATTATVTATLPNVGTAGTYGSATQVPVITTDAQGRVSTVALTTIAPAWSSLTSVPAGISAYAVNMNQNVRTTDAVTFAGLTSSGAAAFNGGATVTAGAAVTNALAVTPTWNNAATAYNGVLLNVTNTASAAASKLLDLQVGGVSKFNVTPAGVVTATTFTGALTGNASTASALQTARTIGMTGDGTWSVSFDGSGNASAGMVLANSGVTAGTYGSATTVPVLTVDAKGRITSATTATVTATLPNVGTAGTYGSATQVPVITTDAQGRVSAVALTTMTPAWSSLTSVPAGISTYAVNMNQNVRTTDAVTFAGVTNTGNESVTGTLTVGGAARLSSPMVAWNTTTPGLGVGNLHIGNASAIASSGGAITFGARDSGSGATAMAGIYTITDGAFGSKMYLATTDSYVTGAKVALSIDQAGNVTVNRGTLYSNSLSVAGTLFASGAATTYGALTIQGAKNSYSGLNFKDASGNNNGTLMMNASYSGFYNAADAGWRWYVDNSGIQYLQNYTVLAAVATNGAACATAGSIARDASNNVYVCQ